MVMFLYRNLLTRYVKTFRKDFGKKLNPWSSVLFDDFQSAKNTSVIFSLKLEKPVTLERITNIFENNILQAKLQTQTRYPELKQYPVTVGGYLFWKSDQNFNVKNHIREWEDTNQSNEDMANMAKLHQNILHRPWKENRSPWELFLVNDKEKTFQNTKGSCIFLRTHHCMADAISLIKLIVEGLGQKKLNIAKANYNQNISVWNAGLQYLLRPTHYLRTAIQFKQIADEGKNHPWNMLNQRDSLINSKSFVGISPQISMSKLKKIAKRNNAHTSSVVLSIISGAVANLYNDNNDTLKRETLPFMIPLPMQNHPPTLTNHMYNGVVKLPMQNISPTLRLQRCNEEYGKMKKSEFPKYLSACINQVGNLPQGLPRKLLDSNPGFVSILTNVSFDQEGFAVDGNQCTDISATIGVNFGSVGVIILAIGYMDTLQVSVVANSLAMNEDQVQKLVKEVKNQFEALCDDTGS